ncbi:hypothetical protein ABTZ93_42290 [Streptomyces sp. NPDC097941]|uniref:RICIN domain-containing protein n=1 Tax=Streptomyces sp. NPDC097941 TaxID=3155685 RepID=UPI00333211F6
MRWKNAPNAARVVQANADGRSSQQWQLRPQTGGVFAVVNRNKEAAPQTVPH